jgi:hypothetical protein
MKGPLACFVKGALCFVLMVSWSSSSFGQASRGEAKDVRSAEEAAEKAMHLGHDGLRLYSEEEWKQAALVFEQAEALVHSPVFLLYAARAHAKLEEFDRAMFLYRACAGEVLRASSPAPWSDSVRNAEQELAELRAETSGVLFVLDDGWTFPVTFQILGNEFTSEATQIAAVRSPGHYLVRATDAKGRVASQNWQARAGKHDVVIVFSARLLGVGARPAPQGRASNERVDAPFLWSPYKKAAVASFGAGGLSLIAGGIAGIVAVSESQKLKDACVGSLCPTEVEFRKDSALRAGRLATAGLVVAGVGAVAGTLLWILPDGSRASFAAGPSSAALRLSGRF